MAEKHLITISGSDYIGESDPWATGISTSKAPQSDLPLTALLMKSRVAGKAFYEEIEFLVLEDGIFLVYLKKIRFPWLSAELKCY